MCARALPGCSPGACTAHCWRYACLLPELRLLANGFAISLTKGGLLSTMKVLDLD